MRTRQRERLAAETAADKRCQTAADECPSPQTERLPAESANERDIRLQMRTCQCERLTAETTLKEMPDFTANETNWQLRKICQV